MVSVSDHRNSKWEVRNGSRTSPAHSLDSNLPSIQFTRKAAVFGLARKELGHDRLAENAAVTDDKGLAVRQPANGIPVDLVIENLLQAHGKDLRIVVFIVRVVGVLHGVFVGAHGRWIDCCEYGWWWVAKVFAVDYKRWWYVNFIRRRRNQRVGLDG